MSTNDEIAYLRLVNQRLVAVLDSLADNVIIHDAEGRLAWMNRRTRETAAAMGRDPDAFIGKPTSALPAWVTSAIDEVRARGAATREILVAFPDGARWREDKATAIRGADGIEGFVFVSRDIDDRKLTEARVRAMACVSALPRSPDPVPLLDALAGTLIPDLADWALTVRDLGDPGLGEVTAALAAGRAALVQDPRGALFERDGVRSLIAVPLVDAGALLLGMTARSNRRFTADDLALTEGLVERVRQVAENARLTEALAQSEARFRVALGTSNIAVFEQQRGAAPSWIHNPHFGRLADEPDARRGDDFSFLLRAPDYAALVADVLASGARLQKEIGFVAGGEPRHVEVSLEPIVDSTAGAVVGVTGAAVDVSDARRAQDELAQAVVFRERVLSVLGHDLGNPLAAVRGLAALLLRRTSPGLDPDGREIVEQIDLAARRMHEMIETVIDFSRARFKGGLLIRRRPADLRDVAANVIRELEAARPGRVIQLAVDGETRGAWDAARLAQALSNLIGNALTHGAHDRPVRVHIGEGYLSVSNEGEAIPPEVRATIFEPFRRGLGKEEAHVPGLGLGLYIVREIAHAHGGEVTVESTPAGTTFTMRLPRSP